MKSNNWAILMSGWGRSVIKTLELYEENNIPGHNINLIIYENEENGIVDYAKRLEINHILLPKSSFENDNAYYNELIGTLEYFNINYIFLMGYKHIVREPLLSNYSNKIINIHPALLPSFRGKKAIQQAMNYGVKITGITTHLIDEEIDKGKIICQRCIFLKDGETFEELDKRFIAEGKKIIQDTFNEISNYD